MPSDVPCDVCDGKGRVEAYKEEPSQGTEMVVCSQCGGHGTLDRRRNCVPVKDLKQFHTDMHDPTPADGPDWLRSMGFFTYSESPRTYTKLKRIVVSHNQNEGWTLGATERELCGGFVVRWLVKHPTRGQVRCLILALDEDE